MQEIKIQVNENEIIDIYQIFLKMVCALEENKLITPFMSGYYLGQMTKQKFYFDVNAFYN